MKKYDCPTKKIHDLKFFEFEIQKKNNCKNIMKIHSFWSEENENPNIYKSLILDQELCEKNSIANL